MNGILTNKIFFRKSIFVFLACFVFFGSFFFSTHSAVAAEADAVTKTQAKQAENITCNIPIAGLVVGTGPIVNPVGCKALADAIASTQDDIIKPEKRFFIIQALVQFEDFILKRLAYEAAMAIANGGPGKDSLFYDKDLSSSLKAVGEMAAGEAIGDLNEAIAKTNIKFNLCVPPNALFRLGLQLGIKQQFRPVPPKCNFDQIANNWESFWADAKNTYLEPDGLNRFLLKTAQQAMRPNSNELGASIQFLVTTDAKVNDAKTLFEGDYQSTNGYKNVKDAVTGKITTPSDIVQKTLNNRLENYDVDAKDKFSIWGNVLSWDAQTPMLLNALNTFVNTLGSQYFDKVYKGLFTSTPDHFDPFNTESVSLGNDVESSKKQLSEVFATTPISISHYDVLSNFLSCPDVNISNRSIDTCVIDDSFFKVLSFGASSNPLTVKEAIESKDINGDWSLISDIDTEKNNDPNCRTYGFCYGNLVKMRKARIVPVGWEIAAHKNSTDHPKTLKQVMDAFNDCNGQGLLDAEHPWCHLIDPNWVLKAPESECRAMVNGEIRNSLNLPGRQTYCADAPTCIGEDNNGKCDKGFGYCVEEKNIWRIKGDVCPSYYATCLSLRNTFDGSQNNVLLNTVDNSVCSQSNAGCAWYKTQKSVDAKGVYQWYNGKNPYDVAVQGGSLKFNGSTPSNINETDYSYQDRIYLTHSSKSCAQDQTGCTELNVQEASLALNLIQNGSFEKDTDNNGRPDNWTFDSSVSVKLDSSGSAFDGDKSLQINKVKNSNGLPVVYQIVSVMPGNFYTLSAYVSSKVSTNDFNLTIIPLDDSGKNVDLSGIKTSDECVVVNNNVIDLKSASVEPSDGWKKFTCTFAIPKNAFQLNVGLNDYSLSDSSDIRFDGVQLEVGENATTFTADGYNTQSPKKVYLKLPPSYLGCKGLASDPVECKSYAPMCQSVDVGCNLYTPALTGPNVPAITSALDACPTECVGYDTFKQEATKYEAADFPQYFIADTAAACSKQAVGCDGFTKIGTVAAGGETQRYFTGLRACLTESMADGSSIAKKQATYFTWEGSDNTGYQLQTWNLLQSNASVNTLAFAAVPNGSGFVEKSPGLAPCTKVQNVDESTVVCADDQTDGQAPNIIAHFTNIENDSSCDEHGDIITNPDCREFFDASGNIHYRRYSQTVSIDNACEPFRKDKSTKENCDSTGGFWTTQGFCRYFGLEKESNVCSATENGCREYTGGAGRNASTILDEIFENGISNWQIWKEKGGNANMMTPSNDSVFATGHSLAFKDADNINRGISTLQVYYNDQNISDVCPTDGGCQTNKSGAKIACTIEKGKTGCGALVGKLKQGKIYTLQFWAKGTAQLYVGLQDKGGQGTLYDFVDTKNTQTTQLTGVLNLEPNWRVYNLGPIDTSDKNRFSNFNDNAVLVFFTDQSASFNIDNVQLTETASALTVIKDSWVTPASCDQTPDGISTPQHYLGCKAYTDQHGAHGSYYQFSHVCSEQAVGCGAYYNTFNSDSAYGEVNNARCVYGGDKNDFANGAEVKSPTDCSVNGTTYCTIGYGQSYCVFKSNRVFESPLPNDTSTHFGIVYGPETVVTPQDQPVFAIDNGSNTCNEAFKGCREVGKPKYSQDLKTVTGFDSVYVLDQPKDYSNILCENKALFCEEYSSNQGRNFYFKNPQNKTCEYKTSVTIGAKTFEGWFREGTSDPCYWKDENGDGKYDPNVDSAYLTSGEQSEIWKNGDAKYDGWVGKCDASSDSCSALLDVTDTSVENRGAGKAYYFINNDKLTNKSVTNADQCNGSVSQKAGCALFDITTNSKLTSNANASYVLSLHADDLLNKSPNDLVDPVDCENGNGSKHNITSDSAIKLGLGGNATIIDLCMRRCAYAPPDGDSLLSLLAQVSGNVTYERSCYVDSDCPVLGTRLNSEAKLHGTCKNMTSENFRLPNDSNTVIKVARDRTCSAWLACSSGRTSWDQNNNKYIHICDAVKLCSKGVMQGNDAQCSAWTSRPPVIFSGREYSARDVSWAGREYSGYEIPNQLPVERYTQVNLRTKGEKWCQKDHAKICKKDADCLIVAIGGPEGSKGPCVNATPIYRLAYSAGYCGSKDNSGLGGDCDVGICSKSKDTCSTDKECTGGAEDACVFGYCENISAIHCTSKQGDTPTKSISCIGAKDAEGKSTPVCDTSVSPSVCVNLSSEVCSTLDTSKQCSAGSVCVPAATTSHGKCYNNQCLTDIRDSKGDGFADPLDSNNINNEQSCRGYPEIDSPFPSKVVNQWASSDDVGYDFPNATNIFALKKPWDKPFRFVSGYQDSKVCSPDPITGIVSDQCLCTYRKVDYGKGIETKYYPQYGTPAPHSVCTIGKKKGASCTQDADCALKKDELAQDNPKEDQDQSEVKGSCTPVSSDKTYYGWQGYCLEKDTTVHLNASTESDDRACLTWLPVDQLTGSTDLYGKDTSAGYKFEDVNYCADVGASYDIGISGEACALPSTQFGLGGCNDNKIGFAQDVTNINYLGYSGAGYGASVYCPPNFFAIMTFCGDNAPGGPSAPLCHHTTQDSAGYFCVPMNSFHTDPKHKDGNGKDLVNTRCLSPVDTGADTAFPKAGASIFGSQICLNSTSGNTCGGFVSKAMSQKADGTEIGPQSTNVYLYYGLDSDADKNATFKQMEDYYKDCTVKGASQTIFNKYFPNGAVVPRHGESSGYYQLTFGSLKQYPACLSLVQTSSKDSFTNEVSNDVIHNNVAWTDRLWSGSTFKIESSPPTDISALFTFNLSTLIQPFGSAKEIPIAVIDNAPLKAAACINESLKKTPNADLSCPANYTPSETKDNEARSFLKFNSSFANAIANNKYCKVVDQDTHLCKIGTLTVFEGSKAEECNWDQSNGFFSVLGDWKIGGDGSDKGGPILCDHHCVNGSDDRKPCSADKDCKKSDDGKNVNAFPKAFCTSSSSCLNNKQIVTCKEDKDCDTGTKCIPGSQVCIGGPYQNTSCSNVDNCRVNTFVEDGEDEYCVLKTSIPTFTVSDKSDDAVKRLDQIFAKSFLLHPFTDANYDGKDKVYGKYDKNNEPVDLLNKKNDWAWDVRATAGGISPTPPVIVSLGDCTGTECTEKHNDNFSMNGQEDGVIQGVGSKHTDATFFVYADKNQMPLRNIVMDWSDDMEPKDWGDKLWPSVPTTSAPNNYYKNHRGLDSKPPHASLCDTKQFGFGGSNDGCASGYLLFTHDYTCTQGDVEALKINGRTCGAGGQQFYPCVELSPDGSSGSCVFKPRVFAIDNWGWCTGKCNVNKSDNTDSCFSGDAKDPTNECDFQNCPGDNCLATISSGNDNPWIDFAGEIKIKPE